MAGAKQILGSSMMERSSLVPSTGFLLTQRFRQQKNQLHFPPVLVPSVKRGLHSRRTAKTVVAAVSEKIAKTVPEKPVKFKVRAVLTVRKKNKEDLKETFVNHFDALTEKIGRKVGLQLFSSEINPSKLFFLSGFLFFLLVNVNF